MSIGSVQRSAGRKEAEMSKAPPTPSQQRRTPSVARHLAQQKQAEALPDLERRKELGHDLSLACLVKSVCPGCGRPTDLDNEQIDFCPHCGISLFHPCVPPTPRTSPIPRYCTLLPCLWKGGEWGSRLAWLIMPAGAAARGFCAAPRRRCGKRAQ